MKKILLLAFVVFTFMACPQDDDMPPTDSTSIIGTWKYYKAFENGIEEQLDLCETEETLIFSSNGDYSGAYYEEFNGTCELEGNVVGTWSLTENIYNITVDGQTESETIFFENDTFYFEDIEVFDGETTTYKDVYKRQ
ncbi:lipocalin-like domain-containing protein [Lacinutrix jangbogonensis]|uniref:lipocalin family protein n=1 Tax=Lacinutrix jangbogonensis TaxID=1469557 RepID=UPI00053E43E3|nr:lipocalin family protein [Lacinutrix jangbogonensis]